jgi:hypothetical protein
MKVNKNIDVLNDNLWAVRFSLLDFIPEIDFLPDPNIPIHDEPGRVTSDGLLILNKDHKGYPLCKVRFPILMEMTVKQLKKEFSNSFSIKGKVQGVGELYRSMIQVELERREKVKASKKTKIPMLGKLLKSGKG